MEKYTIYCTAEQTKKALILRAPIEHWGNTSNLITPTAEQMIGWLEEQGVNIVIGRFFATWAFKLEKITDQGEGNLHIEAIELSSRREATRAAIDAALDYLMKNKK